MAGGLSDFQGLKIHWRPDTILATFLKITGRPKDMGKSKTNVILPLNDYISIGFHLKSGTNAKCT